MQARPRSAGLLIMLAGPFLAFLVSLILLSFTLMIYPDPAYSLGELVLIMFVACYIFGTVPAVTAAALVAHGIDTKGWIGLGRWSLVTLLLGIATPSALYVLAGELLPRHIVSYAGITAIFLVATVSSSLILRLLIIGLGWMRRRPPPIWEVF